MKGARFTEIDLLRFLAALAVMLLHYGIRGFAEADRLSPLHFPLLGPLVKYNYLGVNLFFMISGFVILMTVQGRGLREFFVSRVVRLYPAYWVCCTLTFAVILLFARDHIYTSLPRYLLNLTMLNGFVGIGGIDGPYWSLCTELKFYFLVGLLVAAGQIPNVQYYLGLWLAAAILHLAWPTPAVEYLLIPEFSAYFIAGATFYLVHREGLTLYRALLLGGSFAVGLAYDATTLIAKAYWYRMPFSVGELACILGGFYAAFLWISLRRARPSDAPLGRRDRLFVFLGSVSYPLYLLHNNIGLTVFNRLHAYVDPHVLLAGTMLAMICLARLVHVQVERRYGPHLQRALLRISAPWDGKPDSLPRSA